MSQTQSGSMVLVNTTWNDQKTFKLIPLTNDAPYVECIYDKESGIFVIISKITRTALHMLPRLDENGDSIPVKSGRRANGKAVKEVRTSIEVFQEYYIETEEDMNTIISAHAFNPEFNWREFLKKD
jgi:hypothetical protein